MPLARRSRFQFLGAIDADQFADVVPEPEPLRAGVGRPGLQMDDRRPTPVRVDGMRELLNHHRILA